MPVLHLHLVIDTLCADADAIRTCLSGWNVLHCEALLNRRWAEYSAETFVKDLELHNVQWTMVYDDTPGTISLSIARRGDTKLLTESGFDRIEGVEVYPVEDAPAD